MIDGFVMLGGGLLVSYYAWYGGAQAGDAPAVARWQQWHQDYGRMLKVGGVVMTGLGLLRILVAINA